MSDKKTAICPKCGRIYILPGALSRDDNRTEICSGCGMKEALEAFEIQRQSSNER